MNLLQLTARLDQVFGIPSHPENLVEWAVTDDNREFVSQDFLDKKTALMIEASSQVDRVYTSVFVTDTIVQKLTSEQNGLLFTHHHFDYHEDHRGLQPVSPEVMATLLKSNNSLYVAHAPLDTHTEYGTSMALARLANVTVEKSFYHYYGAPTAVVGQVPRTDSRVFTAFIQKQLERPAMDFIGCRPYVERIAVAAGGGDLPDLLQEAHDLGCDTLLTGTAKNRWEVPCFQEANRRFHELNETLKLNLIGGTHFGTERPAMREVTRLFRSWGLACEYLEDEELLSAP